MDAAAAVVSDDDSIATDLLSTFNPAMVNVIESMEDDDEYTDESVNDSGCEIEYESDEEIDQNSGKKRDEENNQEDDSSASSSSEESEPKVHIMPTILENPDSPCEASSASSGTGRVKNVVRIFNMGKIPYNVEKTADDHHLLLQDDNEVWEELSSADNSEDGEDLDIEEEFEEVEIPVEESLSRLYVPMISSADNADQSPDVPLVDEDSHHGIFVDGDDEELLEVSPESDSDSSSSQDPTDTTDLSKVITALPTVSDDLENDPEQPETLCDRKRSGERSARSTQPTSSYKYRIFIILTLFLVTITGVALWLWVENEPREVSPMPPTTAPTTNTQQPTSPTNPYRYEQIRDGVITGQSNSVLGSSVAYDAGLLVAGLPSNSEVFSFRMDSNISQSSSIDGTEISTGFGWSIDLADSRYLAVGAPFLRAAGKTTRVGGAFVYRYDQNGEWEPVGSLLRGDEDLFAANENFGSAIAVSHLGNGRLRVIVGAPQSSLDWSTDTGRVYTFERNIDPESGELLWRTAERVPIIGERAGVRLGMSVASSRDGSMFLAGAPGSDFATTPGYIVAYQYIPVADDPWRLVFASRGVQRNEEFGASVAVLSDNGDIIAVGAPGFNESAGRVVVYRKGVNGLYRQLGPDILGDNGDRIGEAKILDGGINENSQPSVLVATTSGLVKRYDYSSDSDEWEELYDSLDTGFDRITSLASTGEDEQYLVVGSVANNALALFRSARG